MSACHYRLLLGVAASVSLLTAGCSTERPPDPVTGAAAPQTTRQVPISQDTEETLFTLLGLAKRPSEQQIGPQTGSTVSPVLWQATQETLHFAGVSSEDPMTGLFVTDWYSPPNNRAERLRVSVFVLSRALRSDSIAVNVDRQERSSDGQWHDTPVARDAVTGLENAILLRARQIHAERYRNTM
jgi:Domain of unknown function (DUF3576)